MEHSLVQILELVAVRKEKLKGNLRVPLGGCLRHLSYTSSFRPKRQMVSREPLRDASQSVLRTQ